MRDPSSAWSWDLASSLRRAAAGYRTAAVLWMIVLVAVELASVGIEGAAVGWVAAMVVAAVAWTSFTWAVVESQPALLRRWSFLALDVLLSAATLLIPDLVGIGDVYGGYPISSVFVAIVGRGSLVGIAVGLGLGALQAVRRLTVPGGASPTAVWGSVLVFVFTAVIAAWVVDLLRRADAARRSAEAELAREQALRARAEERAEVGARIHDSVLQALALIQRTQDPDEMRAVARAQERDLRRWLFGEPSRSGGLGASLREVAATVEDLHRVRIDAVLVGDLEAVTGPRAEALLGAVREALTNAAVHGGVDAVSLYCEGTAEGVRCFVRDRGVGFDLAAIPDDRHGVRRSIVERMERHGGTAVVRTAPGRGTEVELWLPAGTGDGRDDEEGAGT